MRSSIVRRPLALLACFVQLVLGGATGFADAWLESASPGPVTPHIEESGQSCPPTHSEDCLVCRQITALYGPAAAPGAGLPVTGGSAQRDRDATESSPGRLARALLPRAPPTA